MAAFKSFADPIGALNERCGRLDEHDVKNTAMSPTPDWAPRGTLVVHDSRLNLAARVGVGAVTLAVCGAVLVFADAPLYALALPLLGVLAFGTYVGILLRQILVRRPALVFDPHGIVDRRLSPRRISWSEITQARLSSATGSVALWLADPQPYWSSMPAVRRFLTRLGPHAVFGHVLLFRYMSRRNANAMRGYLVAALPGRMRVDFNRTLRDEWPEFRREGEVEYDDSRSRGTGDPRGGG